MILSWERERDSERKKHHTSSKLFSSMASAAAATLVVVTSLFAALSDVSSGFGGLLVSKHFSLESFFDSATYASRFELADQTSEPRHARKKHQIHINWKQYQRVLKCWLRYAKEWVITGILVDLSVLVLFTQVHVAQSLRASPNLHIYSYTSSCLAF